jgi:rhamnulokinase
MSSVHLAVDLGAESGRVIAGVVDADGVTLDELHRFPNGVHYFVSQAADGSLRDSLRWDVVRLWDDIQHGLREAGRKYGERITSVGVDTWGVDYVLLSKSRELLGQPFCYRDGRNDDRMEEVFETVPRDEIYATTGLQFMQINSLYQLVSTRAQTPELLENASRFLMIPDFFHWLMCGREAVEFTNATTTQFVDPKTRDWSNGLLERLSLPTDILPEIVEPGSTLGTLRADLAARCELPEINVVAPPTHDTASAIVAVPTEHTGSANWAYISSGTWSLIGVETQEPILTDAALAQNITNEGGVDGTTRLLKNVMGLWIVQGVKRSIEASGRTTDYGTLTQQGREAEPFRSLIDPDDDRFLAADDMAAAIQDFCRETSQPIPETDGQLVRCVLESLALRYRKVLRGIEELTGQAVEVLHIVGGGSQNGLLNELTATACEVPVVAGPIEATALGNVLTQARALESSPINDLASIRKLVRETHELVRFEPQETADLSGVISRFEGLER